MSTRPSAIFDAMALAIRMLAQPQFDMRPLREAGATALMRPFDD